MKHTHKPRGHIWTHSSAFQQTKEFRNIRYEECTAEPAKALVRDDDRDLSSAERATKRRRVEKLADDFLDGIPLFISSAVPCPQDLKAAIVWNKKSWDEPKFVFSTVDRSDDPPEGSGLWEDVESDAEILERLSRQHQASAEKIPGDGLQPVDSGDSGEVVDAEEAQASCGLATRLKKVKITAGPSEDALRQAAALRARRLQRANSEIALVPYNLSTLAQLTDIGAEPRSEPPRGIQKEIESRRTPQWLSRRQSLFAFAGEDVSDSIDELQLPDVDTPSQTTHRPNDSKEHPKQTSIVSKQSPAPTKDRKTRSQTAYIKAQSSQGTSTPLLYRKGRLRSRGSASEDFDSERKEKSEISETSIQNGSTINEPAAENLPAAPVDQPLRDTSSNLDSSVAPNPNMALVDEHLNSVLHSTPNSAGRSSSIKKELQRELRNSGAEITRCNSEPPASSDIEQPLSSIDPPPTNVSEQGESLQEKWAGTQFLLKQAQKDLIPSPEKPTSSHKSATEATPVKEVDRALLESVRRGPLKHVSQEPMPSTQQLLGDFEGWSTVKKPRNAQPYSPLPTPTATGKIRLAPIHLKGKPLSSGLETTIEGQGRGRSSLRFSIPVGSSPVDTSFNHDSVLYQSPPSRMEELHTSTFAEFIQSRNSQQRSTGHPLHSQPQFPSTDGVQENSAAGSFTMRPLPSSFPGARDDGSTLLHDCVNWDETIDDLTKDVLRLDDMEQVMSQIG